VNHDYTHLDLFSGIGGFALAARACGVRTVGFCECEPYARQVIEERFGAVADAESERCREARGLRRDESAQRAAGSGARLHADIRTIDGTQYMGVWLLTGGFPCQPYSIAGKRGGSSDDRALWAEMLRVINESRPTWVLGENVPGIVAMELDCVLSDLEGVGYACRPFAVPACAIGADHERNRIWIVAHLDGQRELQPEGRIETLWRRTRDGDQKAFPRRDAYPGLLRKVHGIPHRAHRLRGLGNAIVPQVAEEFIRMMIEQEMPAE
jgi:DNA (cytosine-5)-methyltransferase 1